MALLRMKVTYADNREVTIVISPRAQVETERHFKGTDGAANNRIGSHYYLAWAALRAAGKESSEFESFLDMVADVEEIDPTEEDEKNSDPTQTEASTTGSSD